MDNKDKVDTSVQGIVPRKMKSGGRGRTIASVDADESAERWWYPTTPDKLNHQQKKLVMGCVLEQMIRITFRTHFYE